MTREEAIESLNLDGIEFSGKLRRVNEFLEALTMAIADMEKQIPRKITNYKKAPNARLGNCPICGRRVVKENYCPKCGQALDWSGENE